MKAKERHDLATNELADMLGRWIERVKPYLSYILIGLIIVVVGIWWMNRRREASARAATDTMQGFLAALDTGGVRGPGAGELFDLQIGGLQDFLAAHPDSQLGPLTRHTLAGLLVDRAVHAHVTQGDPAKIDADLARARDLYRSLTGGRDALAPMAEYGLASIDAFEAERSTRPDRQAALADAEQKLLELAKAYPDSAVGTLASARLDTMRNARPLEFAPPKPKPEPPKPAPADPNADKPAADPNADAPAEPNKTSDPNAEAPAAPETAQPAGGGGAAGATP